ncbi:hypothetical protein [Lysobacter olei]
MGDSMGKVGRGNWADPTGLIKGNKWLDPLGFTKTSNAEDPAARAERLERERQERIKQTTGEINALFDDPRRSAQYGQLSKDTTDFLVGDLDRQKVVADRNTKFAMARSGQTGGSVSADANRELGENYLRSVVEATRRGNAEGARLRASDEDARARMIAMVQGGMDAGNAALQANSLLRSNLDTAGSAARAQGMGDAFGQFTDLWRKSQEAAATRRGDLYGYQGVYGRPGPGG